MRNTPPGIGDRNTHHLIVGDGGVFSINIADHPGKVFVSGRGLWVDGWRTDDVLNAVNEGMMVRTHLSEALGERVPVLPVIVLICRDLKIDSPPADVAVLRRRDLIKWLGVHPPVMPLTRATLIAKLARDPSTWNGPS